MIFHVLTLFPEMITQGLAPSIIGRAAEKDIITLDAVNIRDYTSNKHGKVDDYPYGGGAGMLMQAQPVYDAHFAVTKGRPLKTIYVTPQGEPFTQRKARELASEKELVFLCGHYEGIDERALEEIATDYISIGDYILTGGELAAMVMIDAVARLVPGVLGNEFSALEESFHNDLLEYPQYSRPEDWHGKGVPQVLLSGDHKKIAAWRLEQSRRRTEERRPDLYEKYQAKQSLIRCLSRNKRDNIHMMESLARGRGEILYAQGKDVLLYDRDCKVLMAEAEDAVLGEELADRTPGNTEWIVVSQPFFRDIFASRGYEVCFEGEQVLYTGRVSLPVKSKYNQSLSIDRLSRDSLEYVCGHCGTGDRIFESSHPQGDDHSSLDDSCCRYIQERIQAGVVYGAYVDGVLAGYAGMHIDGSLGMLYVEEAYRRRGLGTALAAYAANRMLERGWTPYGYVEAGGPAGGRIQEKLGFYKSGKTFWRLIKSACKQDMDMLEL